MLGLVHVALIGVSIVYFLELRGVLTIINSLPLQAVGASFLEINNVTLNIVYEPLLIREKHGYWTLSRSDDFSKVTCILHMQ